MILELSHLEARGLGFHTSRKRTKPWVTQLSSVRAIYPRHETQPSTLSHSGRRNPGHGAHEQCSPLPEPRTGLGIDGPAVN